MTRLMFIVRSILLRSKPPSMDLREHDSGVKSKPISTFNVNPPQRSSFSYVCGPQMVEEISYGLPPTGGFKLA